MPEIRVHLPEERIVFCGNVFTNHMPPLPGEGHRRLGIDRQAARHNHLTILQGVATEARRRLGRKELK